MLHEERLSLTRLDDIIETRGDSSESLIPILLEAQAAYGYLPQDILKAIAEKLSVPFSQVLGVVTFYPQFHTTLWSAVLCGSAIAPSPLSERLTGYLAHWGKSWIQP